MNVRFGMFYDNTQIWETKNIFKETILVWIPKLKFIFFWYHHFNQ